MTTDLRPLALGELVDRSASVWRAHWQQLFKLYLGFQLVQYAGLRLFELAARLWFPVLRGGRATNEALRGPSDELFKQLLIAGPVVLLLLLLLTFFGHALSTAGSALVVPILYGRPSTVTLALRRTADRLGAMVGLVALSLGWVVGWGLLWMLPALFAAGLAIAIEDQALKILFLGLGTVWAMFGMLLVVFAYVIRFAAAGQVLAMEDGSALETYRRAGALSSGRVGPGGLGLVKVRLTLVITVVGVILMVVTLLGSLPALIIQGTYGHIFDPANADPDAVPQALLVPAQLLQVTLGSLVAPLYAVAMAWFYVDMRMRREGLDLELKLGATPT